MFKKIIFPLMLIAVCVIACSCFAGNQNDAAPSATTNPGDASNGQNGASNEPNSSANPGNGQSDANGQNGMNGQNGVNGQSGMNGQNGSNGQNGMNGQPAYDWITGSNAVAERINMFSEIENSTIIESDGTAVVGVEFADEYKGELTQRIRDMVAGEVMAADSSIQVVAVTSEKEDVAKIKDISSQISSGNTPQDLKQQIDMIARNTTSLR